MENRKVYVVNKSGHDLSAANKYGELVFLTEGKVNIFATDRLLKELEEKLKNSSLNDYLLVSGSVVLGALTIKIMLEIHGTVNLMIFNFKTNDYVVRTIKSTYQGGDSNGD